MSPVSAIVEAVECLDENQLAAFVADELSPKEKQAVEEELDRCDSCRGLLCDWARITMTGLSPQAGNDMEAPQSLRKGSQLARFEIVEYLGAGGMGVVFQAKDPTLGRDIALKVLRRRLRDSAAATERLLQEAQSMAQVKHPNVLTIYDSGAEGDLVFLAIELVEGGDVKEWLKREQPSWKETVRVFADAASGLAAAHAEGIVHRDIKPANLLMSSTGLVKVADFGLAGGFAPVSSVGVQDRLAVVGTLGYMAPEVLEGHPVTEASEQFSLCVSLYEAVCGDRPFAGYTAKDLGQSFRDDAVAFDRVPSALRGVLRKGLSVAPKQRYTSMLTLESELRSILSPRRRWLIAGVALVIAIAGALVWASSSSAARPCQRADTLMNAVWNPQRASSIQASFAETDNPKVGEVFPEIRDGLSSYSSSWLDHQQATCRATRVSGEQSEALLDARMHCLKQHMHTLDSLVSYLEEADSKMVGRAARSVRALPPADDCSAERVVRWRPKIALTSADVERQDQLARGISDTISLYYLGKYKESSDKAQGVIDRADIDRDTRVLAKAFSLLGVALRIQHKPQEASKAFHAAVAPAATIGDDRLTAKLWLWLAATDGSQLEQPELGLAYLEVAAAAIARVGGSTSLEAKIFITRGRLASDLGEHQRSLDAFLKALALRETLPPGKKSGVSSALGMVADAHSRIGNYGLALKADKRAHKLIVEHYGAEHTLAIRALLGIGQGYINQGNFEKGLQYFEQHREMVERTDGRRHESYASSIGSIAMVLAKRGEYDQALVYLEECLDIRKSNKDGPRIIGFTYINLGVAAMAAEYWDRADRYLQDGLAILVETLGAQHPQVAIAHLNLAQTATMAGDNAKAKIHNDRAYLSFKELPEPGLVPAAYKSNLALIAAKQKKWNVAAPLLTEALKLFEEALDENNFETHPLLTDLGEALFHLGELEDAKEYLQRSVKIQTTANSAPLPLGRAQLHLAKVMWASPKHRLAALEMAEAAQSNFVKAGRPNSEAATWLRRKGSPR